MQRAIWCALVLAAAGLFGCGDEASDDGDGSGSDGEVSDGDVSTGEVDDRVDRPEFEECASVSETAVNTRGPADVILAIDNTPSMYNEIEMVRANMNRFSAMVEAEGLDLHVALVSCRTQECTGHDNWFGICIDPPLGAAGACAAETDDSQPPDYLHVEERIESLKAYESLMNAYPQWSTILRPGAAKHIIVISDDNDEIAAAAFNDTLLARDPSLAGYQFHSIYSFLSKEAACDLGSSEPCCTYAAPSGEGIAYRELVALTGGVGADLCLQDFDPVFDAIAGAVVASARLNCEWEIPPPPDGEEFDPDLVNVDFFDGTETHAIGYAGSVDRCSLVAQGWYYDDAVAPTSILVCPQTCEWIQGRPDAQIVIKFGCETEEAIII